MRYVENNPMRAGLVKKAEDYRWSSACAHVGGRIDEVLADDCYMVERINDWFAYLMEKEDTGLIDDIRQHTKTGRPCGNDRFVMKMEKRLGRKLKGLPKGRPQKTN